MQELSIIVRVQGLYEALMPVTARLPALQQQTIGRRAEDATLLLLELLICAKHAPKAHKTACLIKATSQIELVQFHLRILLDKKLANETTLHQLLAKLTEIGRMTGGWRKSSQ